VCGAHDARSTVDWDAKEITVALFSNAGMKTATDTQRDARSGLAIGQCALELHSGGDGVARIAKCGVDTVTRHLYDDPAIALHGRANNRVMASDSLPHLRWLRLPKGGASLDIRKEKGKNLGVFVRPHRAPLNMCGRKHLILS
jgi:hypothetical protein